MKPKVEQVTGFYQAMDEDEEVRRLTAFEVMERSWRRLWLQWQVWGENPGREYFCNLMYTFWDASEHSRDVKKEAKPN